MANLTAYPTNSSPKTTDLILGTKVATPNTDEEPVTTNFTVSSIAGMANISAAYTVYTARLNAGAGAAPTVNVLQNNTGLTLTWTRTGSGVFLATATSGTFGADDFWAQVNARGSEFPSIKWVSTTTCQIDNILCSTAAAVDGLTESYVEIRIYS